MNSAVWHILFNLPYCLVKQQWSQIQGTESISVIWCLELNLKNKNNSKKHPLPPPTKQNKQKIPPVCCCSVDYDHFWSSCPWQDFICQLAFLAFFNEVSWSLSDEFVISKQLQLLSSSCYFAHGWVTVLSLPDFCLKWKERLVDVYRLYEHCLLTVPNMCPLSSRAHFIGPVFQSWSNGT